MSEVKLLQGLLSSNSLGTGWANFGVIVCAINPNSQH